MVYVAVAVAEVVMPDLIAIAFMVLVADTEMGAVYWGEVILGMEPSVEYRMVAPDVAQDRLTFCAEV